MQISKLSDKSHIEDFVKAFQTSNQPKYLFGYNDISKEISSKFEVNGFIIDNSDSFILENYEVINSVNKIPFNSLVISCITNSFINLALNKLKNIHHIHYMDCMCFIDNSKIKLSQIAPIKSARELIDFDNTYFSSISDVLFDDNSKDIFNKIINFRTQADISYLSSFEYNIDLQYFDSVIKFEDEEVFIDGGGFDGFTTINFIKRVPKYKEIHYFEPNKILLEHTKEKLKDYNNIFFHNIGLYDKQGVQKFSLNDGPTSFVNEDGDESIYVDSLDSILNVKPTFIKLDIEGSEMKAIEGMKNIIKMYKPKLAISVYHNASDLVEIPKYILELNPCYKVYFRHYTEGWAESIMYFVP